MSELQIQKGQEFHQFRIYSSFGTLEISYRHMQVERIFSKSIRMKTLKEVGDVSYHLVSKEVLEDEDSNIHGTLEEARLRMLTVAKNNVAWLKEDMQGYTEKHPDYAHRIEIIEMLEDYVALLENYSFEAHEKTMEKWKETKSKHVQKCLGRL